MQGEKNGREVLGLHTSGPGHRTVRKVSVTQITDGTIYHVHIFYIQILHNHS